MPPLKMIGPKETPLGMLYLIEGDIVSDTLAAGNHWDPHVFKALEPYLRPGLAAIDVGANVGALTLRLAERSSEVFAFEPHPTMQACLRLNAQAHGKVEVRGALYSGPVRLRVREQEGNSPSSLAWVPSFDEGVDAGPFDTQALVSVVKIDAQGADLHCILGLEGVIRRSKPIIVFEFEDGLSALHGHRWEDYEFELKRLGYRWELVKDSHQDFIATWGR